MKKPKLSKFSTRTIARSSEKGFTLVELLVVVSIMGLFVGLFLVNFASLRGPRNLKIAQNELITNLRKIQSYTLSSRDVNSQTSARYYILHVVQGSGSYEIQAIGIDKTDSTIKTYFDGSSASQPFVETFKMPAGVTVSALALTTPSGTVVNPAPNCTQIGFASPFAKTYIEYNNNPASCNFFTVTSTAATLDAKANETLTLTLRDNASATTRQVVIRGVTGVIEAQ